MDIEKLLKIDDAPMELLLLADPSEQLVYEYLNRGDCYVAKQNNQIVGVYVLVAVDAALAELVNVAVAEDAQGKGIGKCLVNHAVSNAKSQGFRKIEVGTGNSSIGQLALYQKCGFRIIGVDIDFFSRNYSESIYENGIQCRDMIRLAIYLNEEEIVWNSQH